MKEVREMNVAAPLKESRSRRGETHNAEIARHRAENEELQRLLQSAHEQYAELYEHAPIGFVTLGFGGRIRELNTQAARLLAFPSAWLMNKSFLSFVAPEHLQTFLNFIGASARIREPSTLEASLLVNGRRVPVRLCARSSPNGRAILHHLAMIDLADVRRTEKLLQESLDSWHSLVQNAPEIIMTLDRQGRILFANRPFGGWSPRALAGTHIVDHFNEDDRIKLISCIERIFGSGEGAACEAALNDGNNSLWFSLNFGPVPNREGRSDADRITTVVIREISAHKREEEKLRSAGEQMRNFAARLDAVREEERTHIAREIHDELGQALTVLKLDLSWLERKMPRSQAGSREKLRAAIHHVDDTIRRVRRIASELRPSILDDLGLMPAIEWQLSEFKNRSGIRCVLRSNVDSERFDPESSAAIFRVIQEALTNIMRHAAASMVHVGFRRTDKLLRLTITDNGRGITEDEINNPKSLGVVGMKERVARIGGDFKIQSRRQGGTRIEILLPHQNHD
jgi:PAS domain S-box-containing protein